MWAGLSQAETHNASRPSEVSAISTYSISYHLISSPQKQYSNHSSRDRSILELESRKALRDLLLTRSKIRTHASKVKHRCCIELALDRLFVSRESLRSTLFPSTFAPIYQLRVSLAPCGSTVASNTALTWCAQFSAASGFVSMEVWLWCAM